MVFARDVSRESQPVNLREGFWDPPPPLRVVSQERVPLSLGHEAEFMILISDLKYCRNI